MSVVRAFLSECTTAAEGSNVLASRLFDHFTTWCDARGHSAGGIRQFTKSMGYAGFGASRLDLGSRGFRGIYITGHGREIEKPLLQHLSTLGLAGLRLEMAAGHVTSLAARAASDTTLVGQYVGELENQSIARDCFRAELERCTGLPADLIERRLAL